MWPRDKQLTEAAVAMSPWFTRANTWEYLSALVLVFSAHAANANGFSISPTSLSVTVAAGSGQTSSSVQLTNFTITTLVGSVVQTTSDCSTYEPEAWLSTAMNYQLPPMSTTSFQVDFDASGLAVGTYDATLCFDPQGDKIVIPVTLTVPFVSGDLDMSFHQGFGYSTKAFDLGGGNADFAKAVLVQSNGDIVLVGYAQTDASSTQIAMTRLLPDGTLDSSFGSGGSVVVSPDPTYTNAYVRGAALDPNGGIYVAGYSTSSGGNGFLGHFTANGQLDSAFASTGFYLSLYSFFGVAVDGSGKPVVVGMDGGFGASRLVVARLTASGNLDPSFNLGYAVVTTIGTASPPDDAAFAVTFDNSGRIYLGAEAGAGTLTNKSPAIVRLTEQGQLDSTCGTGGVISTTFGGRIIQAASILFRDAHHGIWTGVVDSALVAFDFDADNCAGGSGPGLVYNGANHGGGHAVAAADGAVYISFTTNAVSPNESRIVVLHDNLPYNSQSFTIYPAMASTGENLALSAGRPLQAITQTVSGANSDFAVARFQNDRIFFANFDRDAPN